MKLVALVSMGALVACSAQLESTADTTLPRPSVTDATGGWPSTGIARLPNGEWAIAHDGRTSETDLSHESRIVIYASDRRSIRREIDLKALLPKMESVQGLAWQGGGLWFADQAGQSVRKLVGGDIVESIPVGFKINGVATDGKLLYLGAFLDPTVRVIDPATGRLVRRFDLRVIPDQMFIAQGKLYTTNGDNGTDGAIHVYQLASGRPRAVFAPLPGVQAIEGLYISGDKGLILNDGGFHKQATPARTFIRTLKGF